MKSLVILGSTGSIGTQTVEVAEHLELKINAISGYANDSLLEKQARRFNVETGKEIQQPENPPCGYIFKGGNRRGGA